MQSFANPSVLVTLLTLALTCILYMRKVPGNLLLAIIGGTVLAYLFGAVPTNAAAGGGGFSWSTYGDVFGQLTVKGLSVMTLIVAVFSLTLVIVFESVGLINAQLNMSGRQERFQRVVQANAATVFLSGILGTSPTVSTVEAAAGISSGGRTGWTSIVTGVLFLLTFIAMPVITLVPDPAVAPILIFIGGLMMPAVRNISFERLEEGLPAFFIIAFIPLMHSIVDGIAIGFISYALFHLAVGKGAKSSPCSISFRSCSSCILCCRRYKRSNGRSPLRTHRRSGGLCGFLREQRESIGIGKYSPIRSHTSPLAACSQAWMAALPP